MTDGTQGWRYTGPMGWQPFQMTDEQWAHKRLTGVGIKTNGIGNRTNYLNRPEPPPRAPFAGAKLDHRRD